MGTVRALDSSVPGGNRHTTLCYRELPWGAASSQVPPGWSSPVAACSCLLILEFNMRRALDAATLPRLVAGGEAESASGECHPAPLRGDTRSGTEGESPREDTSRLDMRRLDMRRLSSTASKADMRDMERCALFGCDCGAQRNWASGDGDGDGD